MLRIPSWTATCRFLREVAYCFTCGIKLLAPTDKWRWTYIGIRRLELRRGLERLNKLPQEFVRVALLLDGIREQFILKETRKSLWRTMSFIAHARFVTASSHYDIVTTLKEVCNFWLQYSLAILRRLKFMAGTSGTENDSRCTL